MHRAHPAGVLEHARFFWRELNHICAVVHLVLKAEVAENHAVVAAVERVFAHLDFPVDGNAFFHGNRGVAVGIERGFYDLLSVNDFNFACHAELVSAALVFEIPIAGLAWNQNQPSLLPFFSSPVRQERRRVLKAAFRFSSGSLCMSFRRF